MKAPPIPATPHPEYSARLDAERVTAEFKVGITLTTPQQDVETLPLFGGERQGELF